MKKVKLSYRFGDINDADKFIDDNKIAYDEIIVLFDTLIEEQPQQQTAKKTISKPIQREEQEQESEEYMEEETEEDPEIERAMLEDLRREKDDLKRKVDSYERKFGKEKKEIPLPPKPLRAGEKPEIKKKPEIINIRV